MMEHPRTGSHWRCRVAVCHSNLACRELFAPEGRAILDAALETDTQKVTVPFTLPDRLMLRSIFDGGNVKASNDYSTARTT